MVTGNKDSLVLAVVYLTRKIKKIDSLEHNLIRETQFDVTFFNALRERITEVIPRTTANRVVIDDLAQSILSTKTWARISAFLPDTGQVCRALRAD